MIALPIAFFALIFIIGAFSAGMQVGKERSRIQKQEARRDRALVNNLQSLAANSAASEPFALIVLDEINQSNNQNRKLP